MEKKVLLAIRKKTDAIPLLFSSYFVFNLSYETGAQSFYHFLEHIFFENQTWVETGSTEASDPTRTVTYWNCVPLIPY